MSAIGIAWALVVLLALVLVVAVRRALEPEGLLPDFNFQDEMLFLQTIVNAMILLGAVIAVIYAARSYSTATDTMRVTVYHDISEEWNSVFDKIVLNPNLMAVMFGEQPPANDGELSETANLLQLLLTVFDKWLVLKEMGAFPTIRGQGTWSPWERTMHYYLGKFTTLKPEADLWNYYALVKKEWEKVQQVKGV